MLTSLPPWWFDKTVSTMRRSISRDSGGGPVVTYTNYLTNLPARIVGTKGGEGNVGPRMSSSQDFQIYFDGAPDIRVTDRVIYAGEVYDIFSTNNPDQADVYTRCDAAQVAPEAVGA